MEPLNEILIVEPSVARSAIAHAVLYPVTHQTNRIGSIDLRPHQAEAVTRIRLAIAEFGGALLCDPVGTGKTYTALAVPDAASRILVIAPAVLRPMWEQAGELTGRPLRIASFEALSRGRLPQGDFDFLIIDEAHHARSRHTRRYGLIATVASRTDTLLLTATPIHNRLDDLVSLLSLFLGERADSLSRSTLSKIVIDRAKLTRSMAGMPVVDDLVWCAIPESREILEALLSLPPPLPPSDGGDGGALVTYSLVRQWSSSNAALMGGLRRRLVRAEALIAALEQGTWPSRMELQSWIAGDDTIQLAFGWFLASTEGNTASLLDTVRAHRDGLVNALSICRSQTTDLHRADLLRRIRGQHPGQSIVAFSQYTDTIEGLYTLLAPDGGVAALSGTGARITGGRISRSDAIRNFAPRANGGSSVSRASLIVLLLTTDLLSEGVNLQDAAIVVHLDLPWTPARMEQRVGRLARIGSQHERVMSYAVSPPANSQDIVRIERILGEKVRQAAVLRGDFLSLRSFTGASASEGIPSITENIRAALDEWFTHEKPLAEYFAAAVEASTSGFIALCRDRSRFFLAACAGDEIADDPAVIREVIALCGRARAADALPEIHSSLQKLSSWLYLRSAAAGVPEMKKAASVSHAAARRIDMAVRKARPHLRARTARLAASARKVVTATKGTALENRISELCAKVHDDLELMKDIASLAPLLRGRSASEAIPVIVGMIVLVETRPLIPETER